MKSTKTFFWGTGRRKSSVARVRVCEGTGKVLVNDRKVEDYFAELKDRNAVLGPIALLSQQNSLDVFVNVQGGGTTGQAGAICQGLARALKDMFEGKDLPNLPVPEPKAVEQTEEGAEVVPSEGTVSRTLRDSGFLTRDSRMKERKKYGRKGARRSFQFSKR
ncbi:MAG: 30S ribosomal protein S9 [Zavarzinella sp.]